MAARSALRSRVVTVVATAVALGGAAGLVVLLPRMVGASWAAIGSSIASVPPLVLLGLVALWFAGLAVHVPVLQAAMPGLRAKQALTLNLAGSSISNVLPLGGPAGMGLGYAMTRSWGFGADRFASYTVATNLWNTLGKFSTSGLILLGAALFGSRLPSGIGSVVISASVFVTVALASALLTFSTERTTRAVGARLDAVRRRVRPGSAEATLTEWLLTSRHELLGAVRTGWRTMSVGVLCYIALQCALFYACLAAVRAEAPPAVVAIAFAVERLISLAPITPGATGIAELGAITALHSFGVAPVDAAAGVLLFRILIFALEIPLGGVLAVAWMHRTGRHPAAAEPALHADPTAPAESPAERGAAA